MSVQRKEHRLPDIGHRQHRQQKSAAIKAAGGCSIRTWLRSNLSKVIEHSDSVMEQKRNGLRSQCEPPKTQHGANMDVVSNHTTSGTDLRRECKHTWSAITQRAEPTQDKSESRLVLTQSISSKRTPSKRKRQRENRPGNLHGHTRSDPVLRDQV